MKPKTVGWYLLGTLLVYYFLVFFVVGIVGNLLVATIGYFKLGHWVLDAGVIYASLKIGIYCGTPVGVGNWVLAWLERPKDGRKH